MSLDPNGARPDLEGIAGTDPAFGLPSVWILPEQRALAESRGYTLVDGPSVLTTHLSELIRRNAHELIGRQEAQDLLAACAKDAPKLVEDTVPGVVSLGELVRVLRGLLREGISVRDLRSILEAVADAAPRSKDTHFLVEQVRRRLARHITARVAAQGVVHALTLERPAEDVLRQSLGHNDGEPALAPDLETARRFIANLERRASSLVAQGKQPILLAPTDLRRPLFDFASRFVPDLAVISARELVPGTTIEPAGTISLH
jgi:flagellar biosynthesis protein FlhA